VIDLTRSISYLCVIIGMTTITLNGSPHEIADEMTVDALLRGLGRDPDAPGVAVAVGDRVVRRAAWPETRVRPGDRVEVVTAAQGG
jgi:sulfur carrier protein